MRQYDLSQMSDKELGELLRELNARNDRYAYDDIKLVVAEITRRAQAQR